MAPRCVNSRGRGPHLARGADVSDSIRVPLVDRSGKPRAWAVVDAEDHESVKDVVWSLHTRGYAQGRVNGKRVLMHRYLLGLESGGGGRGSGVKRPQVDHINRDKLDNRRANLRVVTHKQNHQNMPATGGASEFRGVVKHSKVDKWMARVKVDGHTKYLGLFESEEEAAEAAREGRKRLLPYSVD